VGRVTWFGHRVMKQDCDNAMLKKLMLSVMRGMEIMLSRHLDLAMYPAALQISVRVRGIDRDR
jgi:hypothetical protein